MPAKIIDGQKVAKEIQEELKKKVAILKEKRITPRLAMIQIGGDPETISYSKGISKASDEVGIHLDAIIFPENITEEQVLAKVRELNKDSKTHGIILNLPMPKHITTFTVMNNIDPNKDVDGTHPLNLGMLLMTGEPYFVSPTPAGIQELLLRCGYELRGRRVVIVGSGVRVGKPLAMLITERAGRWDMPGANATVTLTHAVTTDVTRYTIDADILVAATGVPKLIKAEMVKPGVVVIDAGINRISDPIAKSGFRLVGDVDFNAVKEKAAAITPVPGGVGPMTSIMLMANTVKAAQRLAGIE